MLGLDAYGSIPVSSLAGRDFVGRYVSQVSGKCITPSEVSTYHAVGKSVILVYEDNAFDGLGGTKWAQRKAQIAYPILESINWPSDRPVFYAFDFSSGLYPNSYSYMYDFVMAFSAGIDRAPAIYCDSWLAMYMWQRGIPYIWGFGESTGGIEAPWWPASVWQAQTIMLNGQEVDPDTSITPDFGQWPYTPTPEDDVKLYQHDVIIPPNGNGQALTGALFAKSFGANFLSGAGAAGVYSGPFLTPNKDGFTVITVKGPAGTVTVRFGETA